MPNDKSGVTTRQAHAVLDLESRRAKGRKIEQLLGLEHPVSGPLRLLEVGTGSGGIAHYFGTSSPGRYVVDAVDVVDNRIASEGYAFTRVSDTNLPFADGSFDVVISNHVIEHVGEEEQQRAHLRELARVLAVHGKIYLAVPNRWMLLEPHFKLPFLSWLPKRWRHAYVRVARKGDAYDCEPLELRQLESLLRGSGLIHQNICIPAIHATLAIERPAWAGLVRVIPDALIRMSLPLIPTLIYKCRRADDPPASPGSDS